MEARRSPTALQMLRDRCRTRIESTVHPGREQGRNEKAAGECGLLLFWGVASPISLASDRMSVPALVLGSFNLPQDLANLPDVWRIGFRSRGQHCSAARHKRSKVRTTVAASLPGNMTDAAFCAILCVFGRTAR
jgi:hypothetical protein